MPRIAKQVMVANKKGLHARPAALLVQLAGKFEANIDIANQNGEHVNGKSIIGLLMLGAQFETVLTITIDGKDAESAMREFEEFLAKQEEEFVK